MQLVCAACLADTAPDAGVDLPLPGSDVDSAAAATKKQQQQRRSSSKQRRRRRRRQQSDGNDSKKLSLGQTEATKSRCTLPVARGLCGNTSTVGWAAAASAALQS